MRLPGTISWPSESKISRGYKQELTDWSALVEQPTRGLEPLTLAYGDDGGEGAGNAQVPDAKREAVSPFRIPSCDLIRELDIRRNTIPKGGYPIWRDIAFGVRFNYRGSAKEEEAWKAFFRFSERWENGTTPEAHVRKLWDSEGKGSGRPVREGTVLHHLKPMPFLPDGNLAKMADPSDQDAGGYLRPPAFDDLAERVSQPSTKPKSKQNSNPGPLRAEAAGAGDGPTLDDQSRYEPPAFTGLAGRLYQIACEASAREPSILQEAAVINALSALFGRCAVIENGVKGNCCTNLYTLCLAQTGSGKEDVRTLTRSIMSSADRAHELADGSSSDVSFQDALVRSKGRSVLMIDEAGMLLQASKTQAQSWQRRLFALLMSVFGLGLSSLNTRTYRDHKKDLPAVEHPRPTVLLTSTGSDFSRAIDQSDSASGFLNRFLPFVLSDLPLNKKRSDIVKAQAILDLPPDIVAIVLRFSGAKYHASEPSVLPDIAIELTHDARERLLAWKLGHVESMLRRDGMVAETWSRAVELAQRVAGLLAVSDAVVENSQQEGRGLVAQSSPSQVLKTVSEAAQASAGTSTAHCDTSHVEMAIAMVSRGLNQLSEIARLSEHQSTGLAKYKDKVIDMLNGCGEDGATKTELARGPLRSLKYADREDLLQTMVIDEEIKELEPSGERSKAGRPALRYVLAQGNDRTPPL